MKKSNLFSHKTPQNRHPSSWIHPLIIKSQFDCVTKNDGVWFNLKWYNDGSDLEFANSILQISLDNNSCRDCLPIRLVIIQKNHYNEVIILSQNSNQKVLLVSFNMIRSFLNSWILLRLDV